jgi:PTH1 family peptidyl-tRNA hydrolase
MYLIVGLGNPGNKYALTRHNVGFMTVDSFHTSVQGPAWSNEHQALVSKFKLDGQQIILAKPQTFMNNSGQAVRALVDYYKVDMTHLLIVQDEIDLPFAQLRFHKNRGHGGNNGIRSISEHMGTPDYARLKVGVGRPPVPQMNVADYVLQNFSQEEQSKMPDLLNRCCDAVECFMFEGLSQASNKFNG